MKPRTPPAANPSEAAPLPAKPQTRADRVAREAAALRRNLHKRKEQERKRNEQMEARAPERPQ